MTNLLANPTFAPAPVITYPGIIFSRGAAVDGDCIVFDGTGHAPFATFALSAGLTAGDTYRVNLATHELTGTLHVTTAGDTPISLANITAPDGETPPEGFTFIATGTEGGFTVMGDLHDCVARFGAPSLTE